MRQSPIASWRGSRDAALDRDREGCCVSSLLTKSRRIPGRRARRRRRDRRPGGWAAFGIAAQNWLGYSCDRINMEIFHSCEQLLAICLRHAHDEGIDIRDAHDRREGVDAGQGLDRGRDRRAPGRWANVLRVDAPLVQPSPRLGRGRSLHAPRAHALGDLRVSAIYSETKFLIPVATNCTPMHTSSNPMI